MNQVSYEGKLAQLVEIFQGDKEYAKSVLDKWLQKNRAEFEAQLLAEVSRRLEGLDSIVPVTIKIVIDAQGVRVPGEAAAAPAKPAAREKRSAGQKSPLFEP